MNWTVMFGLRVCRVHETVPGRECATKANAISAKFERSPEGVAKARLIAGAPELLTALKALLPCVSEDEERFSKQVTAARKAITKAEDQS